MDNVKAIILVFFVVSFSFFIIALVTIAFLQKKNKTVSERVTSDRRMSDRRQGERRFERSDAGRRSSDRRALERRVKEGTIFDRKNLLEGFSASLSRATG
jgi:hypothetical protein